MTKSVTWHCVICKRLVSDNKKGNKFQLSSFRYSTPKRYGRMCIECKNGLEYQNYVRIGTICS